MVNSTEQGISNAHKTKIPTKIIKKFPALSPSDVAFITLINVKMPTIVDERDKFRAQLS